MIANNHRELCLGRGRNLYTNVINCECALHATGPISSVVGNLQLPENVGMAFLGLGMRSAEPGYVHTSEEAAVEEDFIRSLWLGTRRSDTV